MSSLYDIKAGLPQGYVETNFTTIKSLSKTAEELRDELDRNNDQGNQYIVVHGLTETVCKKLGYDDWPRLGWVGYHITLNDSVGILKLTGGWAESGVMNNVVQKLESLLSKQGTQMGVDYHWCGATIFTGSSPGKQKEGDQCLIPETRMIPRMNPRWPTMVIETGVAESLPRLRNDANWWFNNSEGAVRIVLVIAASGVKKEVTIEKWQLVPPDIKPHPMTRAAFSRLRQQVPTPIPPETLQPAATQRSYAAQVIRITATADEITGAPLIFPFRTLVDRPPRGNERDFVFGLPELRSCARGLFRAI